ncbi:hypothetical protein [Pseudonocardia sp.]|uniref:hypothetical protein n=1 Tax=Pseudonocardia sp. TaxID=60912 RepID=UPI003D1403C3
MPGGPLRTLLITGLLVAVAGCSGNSVSVGSSSSTTTTTTTSGSGGRTSSSLNCRDDVCTLKVSGDPSGTRLGILGRGVRITAIEADAVTVAVDSATARVPAGTTATVGGLSVTVLSTDGQAAELELRRS